MKTSWFLILASASLSLAAEKKIQMKDLPAAVQQAVEHESAGATIRGLAREVENGKTTYEAEMTVNGHAKDVTFDTMGKIVGVEEEVAIDGLPPGCSCRNPESRGQRPAPESRIGYGERKILLRSKLP